jgi:ABC-2 type transport system permease protein
MTRFLAIVRVTVYQLIGRKRSIGLLVLAAVPALIMLLVGLNETDREAEEAFRTVILFLVLAVTTPFIGIVLGSGSMGDERSYKTISYLALRPIRREMIATAKLAAAWLSAFVVAGSGALLTGAAFGFTTGSWEETPAILVATAITSLGFVGAMQVVGYVTDRAVIIGLAYLLIWDWIVTSTADQIATTSIWRMGVSAYAGITGEIADVEDLLLGVLPGAWGALLKVVGIAAVSVIVLAYLMRDRDLVN